MRLPSGVESGCPVERRTFEDGCGHSIVHVDHETGQRLCSWCRTPLPPR